MSRRGPLHKAEAESRRPTPLLEQEVGGSARTDRRDSSKGAKGRGGVCAGARAGRQRQQEEEEGDRGGEEDLRRRRSGAMMVGQ